MKFAFAALLLALAGSFVAACSDSAHGDCSNGTCQCLERSQCTFSCASPPCAVDCEASSTCQATCSDGTCTCEEGASCDFACGSGPCHVFCAGDNRACIGQCWDGQCTCGPASACDFTCLSPPCHTTCEPGSSCVVHCPDGDPGTDNCDITTCATGSTTVCPDGATITCNAPCP